MKLKALSLTILLAFSSLLLAQNLDKEIHIQDIEDALETAGFNIYKYDFGKIQEGHLLLIYIDEIIQDTIYESQKISFRAFNETDDDRNVMKIIAKRDDYLSESFIMNFICPTMSIKRIVKIHRDYQNEHFWKVFEEGDLVYYKKTPLLLYGSMWEDKLSNGKIIYRFCWGSTLKRDLSNAELDKIDHKFLISYELIKK